MYMDPNNMTLQQFVEYADIYEYTQDHFDMERMFMELTLINMHLEAYDFLQETANITLGQIESLMVESGTSDRSYYTEVVFFEEGNKITDGIKKIFSTIGKAIAAFFRKLASIFSSGDKKVEESKAKVKEIDVKQMITAGVQDALDANMKKNQINNDLEQGEAVVHELVNRAQGMMADFHKVFDRADAMMGGGGVKVEAEKVDGDDNILEIIIQKFSNIEEIRQVLGTDSDQAAMFIMTIIKPEYTINTIAFIARMEEAVEKINSILSVEGDLGSTDHYNSFWKIMKKYGPNGMFERIGSLKNEIIAMSKRNESMIISAQVLQQKLATAEKLAAAFEKLATTADIGPADLTTPLGMVGDKIQQGDAQVTNREQIMNDFKGRYDRDKTLYADRGAIAKPLVQKGAKVMNWNTNRVEYMKYLRSVYELSTTMQSICRDVIKLLTDHINCRNNAIAMVNKHVNEINAIAAKGNGMTSPQTSEKPPEKSNQNADVA